MQILFLAAALLTLAQGKAKNDEPADPNAKVAKAHGGKVWVRAEAPPTAEGEELRGWLAANKPKAKVGGRKSADGAWTIHLLAVFKKPAARGPMTLQFFEKGDLVDQTSADNEEAALVYRASYECEPDKGFNKGRAYTVRIGQILKGKFVAYATGELALE